MVGKYNKKIGVHAAILSLLLGLLGAAGASSAQDDVRYIIDTVVVTVREQANDSSRVLARVKSGDEVRLTGESADPYQRVVLEDGTTGWLDTRYLSQRQVARVEAETLRDELTALQALYTESREVQAETEQSLIRLSDDFRIVNEELESLRGSAGNPTDAELKLEQVSEKLSIADAEADRLLRLNKELKESADTRWFLIGAGVLLAGIVLGLALPKGGKKRSSWGQL